MNNPLNTISNRVARLFSRVRQDSAGSQPPKTVSMQPPVVDPDTSRRLEIMLPFFWPERSGPLNWCVSGADAPEAQGTVESLQELDESYRQLPLRVYVNSGDVSLLQVSLPNASRKHLSRAIPYALEDRLLGDIDEQFFTWTKDTGSTLSVGVIGHDRMRAIIEALERDGWFASSLAPATLSAPLLENCWTLACMGDSGWLRTGNASGMHCTELNDSPPYALVKLLADAREKENAPTGLLVINASESLDVHAWAAELGLEIFLPEGGLWENLDRNNPPLELMHDAYASKVRKKTSAHKRWSFILLAAVLVLGNAGAFGWSWFKAYSEYRQLHFKMSTIFAQAFPDQASAIYDPVVQMQRNLDLLRRERGGAGPNDFLNLMSPISKALSRQSISGLDAVQYRNDEIILQLGVDDYEKLDSLVAELKNQDLQVEVKEASSGSKGAHAKISVSRSGGKAT